MIFATLTDLALWTAVALVGIVIVFVLLAPDETNKP